MRTRAAAPKFEQALSALIRQYVKREGPDEVMKCLELQLLMLRIKAEQLYE